MCRATRNVARVTGLPPLKHGADPPSKDLRYFALANMARAFLRAGTTTVRDVGSYDNEAVVLRARSSSAWSRARASCRVAGS